ncbi:NfeD family protein [Intrasporangium sp. DVR]
MVWLGVALVLVAVEAATVDFTFLMLAGGALGGSAAAAVGAPFLVQAIVAAIVAVVLLVTVRPWLKRRFTVEQHHRMGAEANLGRSAYVLDRVTSSNGRVKLAGETWSARTTGDSIEPGEEVVVDAIEGATVVVSRARILGS